MANEREEYFALNDILQRFYCNVDGQCSMRSALPWASSQDFTQQWRDAFHARGIDSLQQLLEEKPEIRDLCYRQLDRLSASRGYPPHITDRLQQLKKELQTSVPFLKSLSMPFVRSRSTHALAAADKLKESVRNDRQLTQEILAIDNSVEVDHSSSLPFEGPADSHETCDFSMDGAEESDLTNPLRCLRRDSRKIKTGPPKKEYFRVQHIRALKKSIRQLCAKQIPTAAIHRVDKNNLRQVQYWEELKNFYTLYKGELDRMSETTQGPVTDGKNKRRRNALKKDSRSYNNAYCKAFFSSATIRTYNKKFCALVYSASPSEMCRKVKAKCCEADQHTSKCEELWESVHQYACVGMLKELGLQL
jgi:hypothetical protein